MTAPTITNPDTIAPDVLPTDVLADPSAGVGALPDPTSGGMSGPDTALGTLAMAQQAEAAAAATGNPAGGGTTTSTQVDVGPIDPRVFAYGGGNASIGQKIVQAAEHYLGVPYKWGGSGAAGVDCSGLVMLAYKAAGISLPRISFQQANAGTRVGSMKNLRPGDLIGWDNSARNNGADHIAIYLGNGQIIEAAHPGSNVRIRRLSANEGEWFIRMGW